MTVLGRAARLSVLAGSTAATLATVHTLFNLTKLRSASPTHALCIRSVSVLVPARDEAATIGACLSSVLAQVGVEDLEICVLDDRSTDGTDQVLRHFRDEPRVTVVGDAGEPPEGWLGKNWACWNLAQRATSEVLVFVDADVVLEPTAISACLSLFDEALANGSTPVAVSLYPRQLSEGLGPRLVQPLLQWSWLTFLPLRRAEASTRSSLVAANGQFLALTRSAYDAIDGHRGTRSNVIEDVALFRNIKRAGLTPLIADGTQLATCQMYRDWPTLRDGYTKSLWSAFGSKVGAAAVLGTLSLMYVAPAVAALGGSRVGAIGYAAGVVGRVAVAHRVRGRQLPESLAHPASIVVLGYLTARSYRERSRGGLRWKGRSVPDGVSARSCLERA